MIPCRGTWVIRQLLAHRVPGTANNTKANGDVRRPARHASHLRRTTPSRGYCSVAVQSDHVTDPVEYNDHNKNEKNPRGSSSSPSSSWSYETDVRTYTRQLGKLKRERKYSEAIALFKKMRADKVPIDAHVYSLVISILGKMKQVDVAVKLFEQYAATPNISKTVYPYNAVLGCFCQQRNVEKAVAWVARIEEDGFEKDASTYTALLDLFHKTGRKSDAEKTIKEMEENDIPIDVAAGAIMLEYYTHSHEYAAAQRVIKKLGERGLLSDPRIVTPMFGALLTESDRQDRPIGEVIQSFESLQGKGLSVDVNGYTMLLTYIRKQMKKPGVNLNEASEQYDRIWKEVKDSKLYLDRHIWSEVLAKHCLTKNHSEVMEVWQRVVSTPGLLDATACNTMLDYYATSNLPSAANDVATILGLFKQRSIKPTLYTYTSLLNIYGMQENMPMFESVWEDMRKAKFKLDSTVYAQAVMAWRKDIPKVKALLAEMMEAGLYWEPQFYNALQLHYYSTSYSKLEDITLEMLSKGIRIVETNVFAKLISHFKYREDRAKHPELYAQDPDQPDDEELDISAIRRRKPTNDKRYLEPNAAAKISLELYKKIRLAGAEPPGDFFKELISLHLHNPLLVIDFVEDAVQLGSVSGSDKLHIAHMALRTLEKATFVLHDDIKEWKDKFEGGGMELARTTLDADDALAFVLFVRSARQALRPAESRSAASILASNEA